MSGRIRLRYPRGVISLRGDVLFSAVIMANSRFLPRAQVGALPLVVHGAARGLEVCATRSRSSA
jgi:hypothetical protein